MTTELQQPHDIASSADPDALEVSIIIPCLNEAESLEGVIREASGALARNGIRGEVIVADNGSSDGSQQIAERSGARCVAVVEKGYGSAVRGGVLAARGKYLIMGDGDASYDFSTIRPFVDKLREGNDLVMGNRFRGQIQPGAMPWMNRWIGTPALTAAANALFGTRVGDVNCGMRGFSKDAFQRMDLQTTGMEFASEMIVRASLLRLRVAEVPTDLRPDKRSRRPHLRRWRDGWRHLRFMLLYSPGWVLLAPGAAMMAVGIVGSALLARGDVYIGAVGFSIHTLLVMAFLVLVGYQLILFAVSTRTYATDAGLLPPSPTLNRLYRYVHLETGLVVGGVATLMGLIGMGLAFATWSRVGFRGLDPVETMRQLIPALVLLALGVQTVFASFFLSMLGLRRSARIHVRTATRS